MALCKLSKEQVSDDIRFHAKNSFVFAEIYGSYYRNCAKSLWKVFHKEHITTKDGTFIIEHLITENIIMDENDYEGFEGLRLSESEDITRVAEIAGFIKKYGEAWALYAEHIGLDYATQESFEEAYQGEWDSEEDFAEDLASETMEIPKHLEFYIDYEKFARDLFINDFFSADGEGCEGYVLPRCFFGGGWGVVLGLLGRNGNKQSAFFVG